MAIDTWTAVDGVANWDAPSDWSGGVPTASSDVVIPDVSGDGGPEVTARFGTVNSINDAVGLELIDAGANFVTGGFTNSGGLDLDNSSTGEGGSSLTIGGALKNSGDMYIGPEDNTLSAPDTVNAARVANPIDTQTGTSGTIFISGSSTAEATLDDASAAGLGAVGALYGAVHLPAMRSWNSARGKSRLSQQ